MNDIKPLTAAMDNLLAWRLGEITSKAAASKDVGDYIDRGLILLRMLNETGFVVYHDPAASLGQEAAK